MSKADGWNRKTPHEWQKDGDNFRARIDRLTGGAVPFYWDVYPLPRSEHLDERGRYMPVAKGSSKTLAGAKEQADTCIAEWVSQTA